MQKKGRLELTWAGKSYETESFEPRLLVEDKEKSYGDDSPNMLIHGDNLLALKALELDYMEAVQCIYIDPPFNTGGRIDASGQEIGYDDGLEHSIWLDMMYVRLKLLRNLLNPTGLIYVHIDDKEQAYLKVIMDEIFGRKNFVQMIAVKRASPAGFKVINPGPLTVTDYILLYAKDKTLMKYIPQRIPVGYDENYNLIINNPNDDPENWSFSKLVDLLYEQYGFKSWKDASNAWGTNWKTVRNSLLGDVALKNADRVVSVRDPHKPSQLIKEKMIESKSNGGKVIEIKRDGMRPIYIFEGGSLSFYKDKLRQIDGELTPTEVLTDFWADINFAGMAKEGAVQFKNSKKPEKLMLLTRERILPTVQRPLCSRWKSRLMRRTVLPRLLQNIFAERYLPPMSFILSSARSWDADVAAQRCGIPRLMAEQHM
jgi:adenine-specific DNA-methyltransferase